MRSSTCWLSRPSWFSMLTFGSIWFIMQNYKISASLQNSLLFPHVFNKDPGCNCGCCMLLCYLFITWGIFDWSLEIIILLFYGGVAVLEALIFFWWVLVGFGGWGSRGAGFLDANSYLHVTVNIFFRQPSMAIFIVTGWSSMAMPYTIRLLIGD